MNMTSSAACGASMPPAGSPQRLGTAHSGLARNNRGARVKPQLTAPCQLAVSPRDPRTSDDTARHDARMAVVTTPYQLLRDALDRHR